MSRLYVFPKFSQGDNLGIRLGGPGLGNLFFPFARAVIYSHENNIPMINPTWPNIKIGPILRNERDKRFYLNLFKSAGIKGPQKYYLLNTIGKIQESDEISLNNIDRNSIIVFSGLRNYFQDIKPHYTLVKEKILSIVKTKYLQNIDADYDCIGIHLRLGDYSKERRNDLEWSLEVIRQMRKALGQKRVLLFSDERESELGEILNKINNVEVGFFGNAISDLVAMSRCRYLIASDSTFSAWAAYLGRMPVIFQKRHFGTVLYEKNEFELVLDNPTDLPSHLIPGRI